MRNRFDPIVGALGIGLAIVSLQASAALAQSPHGKGGRDHVRRHARSLFVRQTGPVLSLQGKPFRFAGANNYYPIYKSQFMVDDVLETAAEHGFSVFRLWAALDIGNADGSNSVDGGGMKEGVYLQYWDPATHQPAFNDGPSGLERLDYILAKAGELGLKVVLPFTNNWREFGGMDQYTRWLQTELADPARSFTHSDFYTDPVIRGWYKAWISHLLNRTNTLTGIKYKNDPTIMTWELANEPRCVGSGVYPRAADCSTDTLTEWADEMSKFVKSIDRNHLVSVGDEGFFCDPGASDWTENCGEGVDSVGFTELEAIDVMSFHLYPDHWGKTAEWGTEWIERHLDAARAANKPVMLGEYGWQDRGSRNTVFKAWNDAIRRNDGAGALFWILSGLQDDGTLYPDYDRFTVYCPGPVCTALGNFGESLSTGRPPRFDPVADHDAVVTEFDTAIAFVPGSNDISYGLHNALAADWIDLAPATRGIQTVVTTPGGIFETHEDGVVVFTPVPGFVGTVENTYTIRDERRQLSNEATLTVTVKPKPSPTVQLFSFESGVEGWAQASFETVAGSVAQSAAFASEGSFGLDVDILNGGWFAATLPTALDLSNRSQLLFDVQAGDQGSGYKVAFQVGSAWTWCEGPDQSLAPNTTTTAEVDLLALLCTAPVATPVLGQVNAVLIYLNGDVVIDDVKAR